MEPKRIYDLYGTTWRALRAVLATVGMFMAFTGDWWVSAMAWACYGMIFLIPVLRQDHAPRPSDPGYEKNEEVNP